MNQERSAAQLERELDISAARIAQLQDELECAYRKVAALRDEVLQKNEALREEESVDLLQQFINWRDAAYVPSRRDGLSQFLRSTPAQAEDVAQTVREISDSDWFDDGWYLATYPQVERLRITPAEHYIRYGASEGKDPSSQFSTLTYLVRYPDVARSGLNPLVHFLRYGLAEGRRAGRS
jgi:hypothetical protein